MRIFLEKVMNRSILTPLIAILLTPWWWVIIQRNILVGLLVFSLSLVVFVYFWRIRFRALFLLLLVLTMILIFIAVRDAFDESIFRNSALDIQQLNKRHEFYAKGLGKVYTNRISLTYLNKFNLPLSKLQSNFFSNLDLNLYFFASHPRERLGVEEFEKYLPIFLPFFLVGFFYIIYVPLSKILIYLIAISLVSSVFSPNYNLGPILFFPIINFMITVGLILSMKIFRR